MLFKILNCMPRWIFPHTAAGFFSSRSIRLSMWATRAVAALYGLPTRVAQP